MEESPADETVETGNDLSVVLAYSRRWPKYLAHWSIRQRVGESDFPVASGEVEALPSAGRSTEEIWEQVREQALAQASAASPPPPVEAEKSGSFFSRLFRRG